MDLDERRWSSTSDKPVFRPTLHSQKTTGPGWTVYTDRVQSTRSKPAIIQCTETVLNKHTKSRLFPCFLVRFLVQGLVAGASNTSNCI